MGVFKKINFGLRKTRNNMSGAIDNVLDSYTSIDEQLFDELEEALVMGDVGVATASEITTRLNDRVRKKGLKKPAQVKEEIKEIVAEMLEGGEDQRRGQNHLYRQIGRYVQGAGQKRHSRRGRHVPRRRHRPT